MAAMQQHWEAEIKMLRNELSEKDQQLLEHARKAKERKTEEKKGNPRPASAPLYPRHAASRHSYAPLPPLHRERGRVTRARIEVVRGSLTAARYGVYLSEYH
jgi:hypothetical protein